MTQENHGNLKGHDVAVDALVEHSIALSHVGKSDHIMIAGRKSLGLLFGVCRRGFVHADCRIARGPHAGEPPADSLWITNPKDAAELRTLIADCGRDLRAGGTLIVGPGPDMSDDAAARLKQVLASCGYVLESEWHAGNDIFLLCLRKRDMSVTLAA